MKDHRGKSKPKEPVTQPLTYRLETVRRHCIGKPGVEETFPFGPDVMVYKVYGKIHASLKPSQRGPRD